MTTLTLDIGTTSLKCSLYNKDISVRKKFTAPIEILEPELGASEINPEKLWSSVCSTISLAINHAKAEGIKITNFGISVHRSTCTVWEAKTGRELHNFITWQDTRGEAIAKQVMKYRSFRALQSVSSALHFVIKNKKFLAGAVVNYKVISICETLFLTNYSGRNDGDKFTVAAGKNST